MRSTAAARRYAKALFSLARDDERVDAVRRELDLLAGLLEQSEELREVLLTPLRPVAERRAVLEALAQRLETSPVVRHFFDFLVDQRRLVDFATIREEYGRLCDEASGRTVAEVLTASALDEAQQQQLREALSQRTGREVALEVRVDPSLIGGAVARVGDVVFDGSLRTQLAQLRSNLTKEV